MIPAASFFSFKALLKLNFLFIISTTKYPIINAIIPTVAYTKVSIEPVSNDTSSEIVFEMIAERITNPRPAYIPADTHPTALFPSFISCGKSTGIIRSIIQCPIIIIISPTHK